MLDCMFSVWRRKMGGTGRQHHPRNGPPRVSSGSPVHPSEAMERHTKKRNVTSEMLKNDHFPICRTVSFLDSDHKMSEERFLKLLKAVTHPEKTSERVFDALRQLEDFEVTPEILLKTSAVKELKKSAKTAKQDVALATKKVIEQWKLKTHTILQNRQKQQSARIAPTDSGSFRTRDGNSTVKSESQTAENLTATRLFPSLSRGDCSTAEIQNGSSSLLRLSSVNSKSVQLTGDQTRDIVRTKFVTLLEGEDASLRDKLLDKMEAACQIEGAILDRFGPASSSEYKQKFRTLMYNLKDPKNGPLRKRILMGQILAKELVVLSTEDLANEDKKRENNSIREKSLRECERGTIEGATTDAFTCPKCRQSKCSYDQMQTRSADEPMTVYISCAICKNRWKQ